MSAPITMPQRWVEQLVPGGQLTGVASDGAIDPAPASGPPLFRGRVAKWTGASVGGLIEFPPNVGGMVVRVWISDTGGTLGVITIEAVDDDGFVVLLATGTIDGSHKSFSWEPAKPVFLPPGHKLVVKSAAAVTTDKAACLAVQLAGGWVQGPFDQAPELGRKQ